MSSSSTTETCGKTDGQGLTYMQSLRALYGEGIITLYRHITENPF